jgi:enoyl-CoA hydratase
LPVSGDVLIRAEEGVGWISLNRPSALNALTTEMCQAMTQALIAWREDPDVRVVVIDHHEGRGFCAGGDVRALVESVAGDGAAAKDFFATEYRLNALIKFFPKPYVAFMDGLTMGGGVGVSVHGAYRIATENTQFAMPETGIGLFPDVGASWVLPRLPGAVGTYMALTGARLDGADCLHAGLATHYCSSDLLDVVRVQIVQAAGARDPAAALKHAIDDSCEAPGEAGLAATRARIDHAYAGETIEEILAGLAAHEGAWAQAQAATLAAKAPLSLKVALRQMQEGARANSFSDVMRMEYRLALRLAFAHDFTEGVRALVIEKDNKPKWAPATLADVTADMVEAAFSPLDAGEELRLLG